MASQGPNTGTMVDGGGGDPWTGGSPLTWDEENVDSDPLNATGFGFSIPSTATITSVTGQITRWSDDVNDGTDYSVNLIVGGSAVSPNKASGSYWPTSSGAQSYTWNVPGDISLTPSQVNASDFGLCLVAQAVRQAGNSYISQMELTVNYTPAGGGTPINGLASGANGLSSAQLLANTPLMLLLDL
jgi:hypothetical protein